MSDIHIILQGKGGVGKSMVAALLAQYMQHKEKDLLCADTDPVNDTFASYTAFNARTIHILDENKNISARNFDGLIEMILEHDGTAIIDNGASTFVPLSAYMTENNVIELLTESGKQVMIHCVITGGQAMQDTITGLNALLKTQTAPIVVWENEYFGEVARDGKRFVESQFFTDNQDRIKGVVTIHRRNPDTFGTDIELMVKGKMTFREALNSEQFGTMSRQRLKIVQKAIFDQLDQVNLQ